MEVEIYIMGQNSFTLSDVVNLELAMNVADARDASLEALIRSWDADPLPELEVFTFPDYFADPEGFREQQRALKEYQEAMERRNAKVIFETNNGIEARITWGGQA